MPPGLFSFLEEYQNNMVFSPRFDLGLCKRSFIFTRLHTTITSDILKFTSHPSILNISASCISNIRSFS